MEVLQIVSNFLAAATVILIAATVAYPMSVLIAQSAEERLTQWRKAAGLNRRVDSLVMRALRFLGVAHVLEIDETGTLPGPQTPQKRAVVPPRRKREVANKVLKRRAQKRFRTCLMGSLHTESEVRADNLCDVVDLSAGGARVRLVEPMAEVSRMTLGLRHFGFFPARVVWRQADEVGLRFELTPIQVVSRMRGLLPATASAGAY